MKNRLLSLLFLSIIIITTSCLPSKRYLYKDIKQVVNSAQATLKAHNAININVIYKDSSHAIINGKWRYYGADIKITKKTILINDNEYPDVPRSKVRVYVRGALTSNDNILQDKILNHMACLLQDFVTTDLNAKQK